MDLVNSTAIRWLDYDPHKQTLDIGFAGGNAGRYFEVPLERYHGLRDHYSPGTYYNDFVKGSYRYEALS